MLNSRCRAVARADPRSDRSWRDGRLREGGSRVPESFRIRLMAWGGGGIYGSAVRGPVGPAGPAGQVEGSPFPVTRPDRLTFLPQNRIKKALIDT